MASDPRVEGWQSFLDRLAQPGLQSALFQLGTQLLQPIQPNQSTAGFFGQALANTLQSYKAQKEAIEKRKRAEKELELKERQVGASEITAEAAKKRAEALETSVKGELEGKEKDRELRKRELELRRKKIESDIGLSEARKKKILVEAKVLEEGRTTDPTGTVAILDRLSNAILSSNPNMTPEKAYLKAVNIWKSTKNLSPEERRAKIFLELKKDVYLSNDPDKQAQQIEQLKNLTNDVMRWLEGGEQQGAGANAPVQAKAPTPEPSPREAMYNALQNTEATPGLVARDPVTKQPAFYAVAGQWIPAEAMEGARPVRGAPEGQGNVPGERVVDVTTGMVYVWQGTLWQPEGILPVLR